MKQTQLGSVNIGRWFPDLAHAVESRFLSFHKNNPHVYELFKHFALEVRRRGFNHYSSKAIMERLRWHIHLDTGNSDFKINNIFSSCYSRTLITEDPSFSTFFSTRRTPGTVEIQ